MQRFLKLGKVVLEDAFLVSFVLVLIRGTTVGWQSACMWWLRRFCMSDGGEVNIEED